MKATSPVLPGENMKEIIIAENQPEYENLPVISLGGGVLLGRYELSDAELETIRKTRSVWLFMHTFGNPIQPISLQVEQPLTQPGEPREIDYMCALRNTETRVTMALNSGVEIAESMCSMCAAGVIFSKVSLRQVEEKQLKVICMECLEDQQQKNPTVEMYVTRETLNELGGLVVEEITQTEQ